MRKQQIERRDPQQERALAKVALILEATTRLLERGSIEALTTNAIAATAGVSIGTLYQYFDDKDAILQALADREMADMSGRIMAALTGEPPAGRGARVGQIVQIVVKAYGERRGAHRQLLQHALARRTPDRLDPLYQAVMRLLTTDGVANADAAARPLAEADAFVATHAVSGVLRAYLAAGDRAPSQEELQFSLTRLLMAFLSDRQPRP